MAGGIAIGAVAQLIIPPWGTLLIGVVGSLISVIGYRYILVSKCYLISLSADDPLAKGSLEGGTLMHCRAGLDLFCNNLQCMN